MFGKLKSIIKSHKKWFIISSIILILFLILTNCGGSKKARKTQQSQEIVEVKIEKISMPIYFNGTIEPLQTFNVMSPVEGIINHIFFKYGQKINVGDQLFSISAEKLEKEYVDSISTYLKALDDYNSKSRKFSGTEQLWKLKFVSDNEYYTDKTAKEESYFMLKQSVKNLNDTLKKIGIERDIKKFDIRNPEVIEEIVTAKLDSYIIASPFQGIALDPKSLTSVTKDDSAKILGAEVKQGEILLHIGDLKGIAVEVKINEIDINQIEPGQKAIVTGPGFSKFRLEGKVEFVKSQAHHDSGALPTFPVRVVIKEITPLQRARIKVGMSAKVEIQAHDQEAIMVPIDAVFQQKGIDFINVKNAKTGEIKPVRVLTGRTTADAIEIEKGLNPGDHVVINH